MRQFSFLDRVKKFLTFKHIMLICVIAIFVLAFVSAFNLGANPGTTTGVVRGGFDNYLQGWANKYGRGYDISELFNYKDEIYITQPFYLYKTVGEMEKGNTLFIHTNNVVVNIYLDGELLHKTADNGDCGKLTAFDNYISFDLPLDAEGKQLTLEIYKTKFSFGFCIDTFNLGSGQEIVGEYLSGSFFPLISAILYAILGVCFILLGAFIQKSIDNYKGYVFFGMFLLAMAVCSMLDNVLAFTTFGDIYGIESCSRIFLIASLAPLMLFVDEKFEMLHYMPLKIMIITSAALSPLAFLLHITGLFPYTSMSIAIHVLSLAGATTLLIELISFMNRVGATKLGKENVEYYAMIFFIVMTVFDVARFYQGNRGTDFTFTRFGIYVLTIAVAFRCFGEVVVLIRYGIKASAIEKIAFTDANTGIGNLAAFRTKFDELERTRTNYKYIAIIQFDVNNLKIINDSKGHEAGDLLIKTAATIINQAFGPIGWCYRTGGDEFVAMTTYNHAPIACEDAIIKFEHLIDRFNKRPDKPFDLYIAYGIEYYEGDNAEKQNLSLKDIHKRADERMYSKKKELKARYAKTPEEAIIR